MASPTIKATYSLDPETVRLLERTARRWSVSKSEVLRRAIRAAATAEAPDDPEAIVDELQKAANLTDAEVRNWARRSRDERRKSSLHRAERG